MNSDRLEALARAFETHHRDSGESFIRLRDDVPQWMQDVVRKAHGDFLPDDWRYELIKRVVGELLDASLNATAVETDDAVTEWWHYHSDDLIDIYNARLLQWVGSRLTRMGYVDEAQEDAGLEPDTPLARRLRLGQHAELTEIFHLLRSCEELNDA